MLVLVLVLEEKSWSWSWSLALKSLSLSWSLEKSPCKGRCSSVFKRNFRINTIVDSPAKLYNFLLPDISLVVLCYLFYAV